MRRSYSIVLHFLGACTLTFKMIRHSGLRLRTLRLSASFTLELLVLYLD